MKKIHYGWYVVIAAMLLNAIGTGIFSSIIGLFFPFLTKAYGYSNAAVGGIISVAIFSGLFATGAFSNLYGKRSTRHLVLFFGVLSALAYASMGLTSTLPALYGASVAVGVFGMGATALSAPMLITNWFDDKKATAMGLAVAGAGAGPFIMVPIITSVLESKGHQTGFFVLGLMVLICIVLSFFLIRNKPEDLGLEPYRVQNSDTADNKPDVGNSRDYMLKEAFKSKSFPGFILFILTMTTVLQGLLIQLASYFTEIGLPVSRIGMIVAGYALVASFGKVIIGTVFDRIGIFRGNFLFFSLILVAIAALMVTGTYTNATYVYIVAAGIGLGITPVVVPLLVSQFYGRKHYSTLYPLFMIMMSFGAIVGSVVSGTLIDSFGFGTFLKIEFAGIILAFLFMQSSILFSRKDVERAKPATEAS